MRTVKFSFTESSANYDDAIQTVQAKPHEKSEIYVTISTRQTGGANERSLRAERAGQVVLWMPHHCTGNGIEEHWKKRTRIRCDSHTFGCRKAEVRLKSPLPSYSWHARDAEGQEQTSCLSCILLGKRKRNNK